MKLPDLTEEKRLWKRGYKTVAGVDEVGRGCFAGPVVAGCVVFSSSFLKGGSSKGVVDLQKDNKIVINDSKKLTSKAREKANIWIRKNALAWGIGEASVGLINRIGIGKATKVAFRKAVANTNARLRLKTDSKLTISFLLIDAFYIPFVRGLRRKNQKAIIKGDTKSISIAAASIIAKVYRDKLMAGLHQKSEYKRYGWVKNKGYGTNDHRSAILKHGTTKYHRKTFIETWLAKQAIKRQ